MVNLRYCASLMWYIENFNVFARILINIHQFSLSCQQLIYSFIIYVWIDIPIPINLTIILFGLEGYVVNVHFGKHWIMRM